MNFRNEECDEYFEENNSLYEVEFLVYKSLVMPAQNNPVLVCTHSSHGCKWGYYQENLWDVGDNSSKT
eukprot:12076196-Ditylum_brightwellii.AAC.1